MSRKKTPPIHPGEILLEEFLKPHGISQYRLSKSINVPPRRINEIVHGKRSISADTALRLALFFGTTERFWMNLQTRYDLEIEKDKLEGMRFGVEGTPTFFINGKMFQSVHSYEELEDRIAEEIDILEKRIR